MPDKTIAVLGGGSFGTALANIAAENGFHSRLYMRDAEQVDEVNRERVNARYMPGYPLHDNLEATADLVAAVQGAPLIIIAIPSTSFRAVLASLKPHLTPDQILVSTTKGIEAEGFRLMSQIMREEIDNPVGVISGPNLAKEIAKRFITATVIASEDARVRELVQQTLSNNYFRVYASNDMYGVELGGALKNIYAIISGMAAALGMGENTRSMIITRSLAEMSRFAVQLGANPMTFIGLSGVGDLIVTCMSPLSRNYRVGYALGEGKTLEQAVAVLGEVAEGVNTLKLVKQQADELEVYMPLVQGLYAVLYNDLSVGEVVEMLMQSGQSSDVEFVLPHDEI